MFKDDNDYKFSVLIVSIILIGLGFIKIEYMYFFGLAFFLAGVILNIYSDERTTLVFFFSHGIIGWGIATVPKLVEIFKNPIMQDNAQKLYVYLIISFIFLILGIITMLIYRINNSTIRTQGFISFLLLSASLVMISLFDYVVPYLL